MFDGDDIAEAYTDEERPDEYPEITDKMVKEYRDEVAWSFAESLIANNKTIQDVTTECNDTINRYNEIYAQPDPWWY